MKNRVRGARRWRMLVAALIAAGLALGVTPAAFAAPPTTGTISGTVSIAFAEDIINPYPAGWVKIERPDGALVVQPPISSEGEWSAELAPGTYIVEFGTTDRSVVDYAFASFYGGASRDTATAIVLASGQTVPGVSGTVRFGGLAKLHPTYSPRPGAPLQAADAADTVLVWYRFDHSAGQYVPLEEDPRVSVASNGTISALLPEGRYAVDALLVSSDPQDTSEDAPQLYFYGSLDDIFVPHKAIIDTAPLTLVTDFYDQIPIYRFWSPVFQGHFYTADRAERDSIIASMPSVWSYEGVAYWAFDHEMPGTVPLERFWSAEYRGHFYTAEQEEKDWLIANLPDLWAYEGTAYWVYPPEAGYLDSKPVFRFWSSSLGRHFYTANPDERDSVIANLASLWSYEGAAFEVPLH